MTPDPTPAELARLIRERRLLAPKDVADQLWARVQALCADPATSARDLKTIYRAIRLSERQKSRAEQAEIRARRRGSPKPPAEPKVEAPAQAPLAADHTFDEWLPIVTPTYDWTPRHLVYMRQILRRVTDGELRKVMFLCPPRHGKSSQNTIRYSAYRLEKDPTMPIIVAAHTMFLARKFSRLTRRIVRPRVALSAERTSAEEWETAAGGGIRYAGVGGGIVGTGAKLIIIDDPIKSREEAKSEAYREKLWDWYVEDLYSRQEPGCAIVLTYSPWHDDDLGGRILDSEDGPNWTVVRLPALAEEGEPDLLGREPGEALWPDRFDEAHLAGIRVVMRNRFYGLYQCRPRPPEGDFFERGWFATVPGSPIPKEAIRWWDLAASEGEGDWTVGLLIEKGEDGIHYVADMVRGRWNPGNRDDVIRSAAQADHAKYIGRCRQWIEQEPGSAGKSQCFALVKLLQGIPTYFEPSTGDKEIRADPAASAAKAGLIRLVKGPWNKAFLDELCEFPTGAHDDIVDALSGAYNKLNERRRIRVLNRGYGS